MGKRGKEEGLKSKKPHFRGVDAPKSIREKLHTNSSAETIAAMSFSLDPPCLVAPPSFLP